MNLRFTSTITRLLFVSLLLLVAAGAAAFDVPHCNGPVSDYAQLLGEAQETRLVEELRAFETRTGHQLALLTVESLEGRTVEDYAMTVAEAWKVGRAQIDDGVLFLIAKRDRKTRIEVGYGLEGSIPDVTAARVLHEIAEPAFKEGDFEGGISASFRALMRAAEGREALGPPASARKISFEWKLPWEAVVVLVFFSAVVATPFVLSFGFLLYNRLRPLPLRPRRRRPSWYDDPYADEVEGSRCRTRGSVHDSSWSGSRTSGSSWGSGSSSSSSSSSGSSGSGGGGSFGGGGASGGW